VVIEMVIERSGRAARERRTKVPLARTQFFQLLGASIFRGFGARDADPVAGPSAVIAAGMRLYIDVTPVVRDCRPTRAELSYSHTEAAATESASAIDSSLRWCAQLSASIPRPERAMTTSSGRTAHRLRQPGCKSSEGQGQALLRMSRRLKTRQVCLVHGPVHGNCVRLRAGEHEADVSRGA
jgi:hypothetical protein